MLKKYKVKEREAETDQSFYFAPININKQKRQYQMLKKYKVKESEAETDQSFYFAPKNINKQKTSV